MRSACPLWPGVLLDHVHVDPAQRARLAAADAGVVEVVRGRGGATRVELGVPRGQIVLPHRVVERNQLAVVDRGVVPDRRGGRARARACAGTSCVRPRPCAAPARAATASTSRPVVVCDRRRSVPRISTRASMRWYSSHCSSMSRSPSTNGGSWRRGSTRSSTIGRAFHRIDFHRIEIASEPSRPEVQTEPMYGWRLDEHAHAGTEHLDEAYVSGYDRKAGFDPTEDVEMLRSHGLNEDSVVVDLGAGTGTFAAAVAPVCGHVIAVDVSPAMTRAALRDRVARPRAPERERRGGRIPLLRARPARRPTSSSPATRCITCPTSGRPSRSTAIARRCCGPAACCVSAISSSTSAPADADERIARMDVGRRDRMPPIGFTAEELAEHVRDEFSTYSWLLEPMLERTGFDIVRARLPPPRVRRVHVHSPVSRRSRVISCR